MSLYTYVCVCIYIYIYIPIRFNNSQTHISYRACLNHAVKWIAEIKVCPGVLSQPN